VVRWKNFTISTTFHRLKIVNFSYNGTCVTGLFRRDVPYIARHGFRRNLFIRNCLWIVFWPWAERGSESVSHKQDGHEEHNSFTIFSSHLLGVAVPLSLQRRAVRLGRWSSTDWGALAPAVWTPLCVRRDRCEGEMNVEGMWYEGEPEGVHTD
jgi:hypothetical protein